MDDILTSEERLRKYSGQLISSILYSDDAGLISTRRVFGEFKPSVFRDEDYVIFSVLYTFKDNHVIPDEEFLSCYLVRNQKIISDARDYINIDAFKDLDDNPIVGYATGVLKRYRELRALPRIDEEEFCLTIEKFKEEFKCSECDSLFYKAGLILTEGLKIGRKSLQGYNDSVAYLKSGLANIEYLLDEKSGKGFINSREEGIVDREGAKPEKIGDFGDLEVLNKALGGVYTSFFYSVTAPTKGGKSKFTTKLAWIMLVMYGVNISVWAHEGGHEAWWAQLRAIHFDYLYNICEPDPAKRIRGVDQDTILKNTFKTDALRSLEEASRIDLFTNPKYGIAYMIDRPFQVDTYIDEVDTSVKLNNSKAVLIDYLQLISPARPSDDPHKAVGMAYQAGLSYANKKNIAFITPAQFKQEFMDKIALSVSSGKDIEVRTAGGESSQVIRTPDVNIALYATTEDLRNNSMTLLSIPSRLNKAFEPTEIYCDLGTCYFSDIDKD